MYEKKLSDTRNKSPVLELEPLDVLNPELDYEYSVHSLFSKSSQAYGFTSPKERHEQGVKHNSITKLDGRYSGKPMFPPQPQVTYRTGTLHKLPIRVEDYRQRHDYDRLDLHRMAERFHEKNFTMKSEDVQISKSRQRLCNVNLKLAAFNDRLLKQAYAELHDRTTPKLKLKKIKQLIAKLEKLPHLYKPAMREGSTKKHVTKWLKNHTDDPETELVGFAAPDLLEPRRFIAMEKTRVSCSDTNVMLGKRKRVDTDEEELDICRIHENGSDTLLVVKGDFIRPLKIAKRQLPPEEEI